MGAVSESLNEKLARPTQAIWLNTDEAAAHAGMSWSTLRQLILDHGMPHIRQGRMWRIEVAVLDEHLRKLADIQVGAA